MANQSNLLPSNIQIIIPYWSNIPPIKKKLNFYEPLLIQSQTTLAATTLSSIQSALNSLQNSLSFSQPYLYIQSPPKIRSPTLAIFHFPIPPLLVNKIVFKIYTNTPFLYTSTIFTSLFSAISASHLAYGHPYNLHQKYFPASAIQLTQAVSRDQRANQTRKD